MLAGARNNAEWCDIVCRSHGLPTRFDDDLWVSLRRSPPAYPDAVTLRPGVGPEDVLAHVDASPGCSVKDSFADVDLTSAGFRVLFEAHWLHRPPQPPPTPAPTAWAPAWRAVTTADQLRVWVAAHGDADGLGTDVLGDPLVTVLGAYDGDTLVGGAVTNRSRGVVGVSNVFGVGRDPAETWSGAVAAVTARYPGTPLVGYERGPDLDAARAAGFVASGPLRVWLKPDTLPG